MSPKALGNYFDFRSALAARESSNNFQAKNQFGYLGAYQLGRPLLADLGLTAQTVNGYEFIPPISESDFLSSPALQNLCFRVHIMKLQQHVRQNFESGLVAMCHLGGPGNVRKLLETGEVFKDGNGVPITDYYKLFEGYSLD